jgi:drug/metabolite transporter (DMT)-like permease
VGTLRVMDRSFQLFFGRGGGAPGLGAMTPRIATAVGGAAIGLWATWPVLSLQTRSVPPFECMTLIFVIAWLTLLCLKPAAQQHAGGAVGWRSWMPPLAFAIGESGSTICFLLAERHISAAEANLIIFLWPAITTALAAAAGLFRLRLRHGAGIALGFGGVVVLMGVALTPSYAGIGLALAGSVCWSFYLLFGLRWRGARSAGLARGFALSALLCAALHLLIEPSVAPDLQTLAVIAVIGVVPTGIANHLWDEGFRYGDSRLLAVMAYATPLVSAVLLTVIGYEPFSLRLVAGALCIVVAGYLSRAESQAAAG